MRYPASSEYHQRNEIGNELLDRNLSESSPCVKRKRAQAAAAVKAQSEALPSGKHKDIPPRAEADGTNSVRNLTPHECKLEIDGVNVLDLGSSDSKASKLADSSSPAALPAENVGKRN